MAGLLDIFSSGGGDTLGLLGMSPQDIQQTRDDAQAQALYGLAARLFQGGNTGQSIAEGLQQGQKLYKSALQNQMQEQLQGFQVQDMLRKRKLEEQALARQAMIDARVAQAYQPAVQAQPAMYYGQETQLPIRDDQGNLMPFATEPVQGRTATLDFQSLAPVLMTSPEGRKTLGELAAAQKAMAGDTFSLAEGAKQFQRNPFTGEVVEVASGAPKREPVPSAIAEYKFAQDQGFKGTFQDFQVAMNQAKAPKFAVDLKDPTAVAKAQSDIVKDWRGVVKDTGAMEVADRYKAAKGAVDEANKGNKTADGALIYAIGKIYDPSGAVQEGDKKTILGNRSIPQTVQAYAQKAFSGQELLPSERQGLLSMASQIVKSKQANLEAQKAPYVSISRQLGGAGELLLNPLSDALTETPSDLMSLARAELARRQKGK
jgi:hypothetical protein